MPGRPVCYAVRVLYRTSVFYSVHNAAQIILAVVGFFGVGIFVLTRLFTTLGRGITADRISQAALFSGLASWLALSLLRHDVVAVTGLGVAMILLRRFFRAQP